MIALIILAIGCLFSAFLFNINVSWGDKNAKVIRNMFAILGGGLLIIPVIHAIVINSSNVGQMIIVGSMPIGLAGMFLALFAIMVSKSSSSKTYNTAINSAITLVAIEAALTFIGLIILIIESMQ